MQSCKSELEINLLTVIIFDEAGLEAFQLVARDDCLGLNIYVALETTGNCNGEEDGNNSWTVNQ